MKKCLHEKRQKPKRKAKPVVSLKFERKPTARRPSLASGVVIAAALAAALHK